MPTRSIRSVAVPVLDGLSPFELGVLCEVFGIDRSADRLGELASRGGEYFPGYDFAVCSPGARPIRTQSGFGIAPDHDLSRLDEADLIGVPALRLDSPPPAELLAALRRAADRGAWVLSVCSGAYVLGAAGLLDGRRCTTHWRYATDLARQYPQARVDPNVLYVADGNVITSAGTAAGLDACLHLVRLVHGSAVANALARRMVTPAHRGGGQAQYIEMPVPPSSGAATLEPLLEWMTAHLDQPLTVDSLAERVHLAPRTFARRFRVETGATPHDWLIGQRILLARQLLEETDLAVETIAARTGLGNAATLRHHFGRRVGTTPQHYRMTFRQRSA